MLAEVSLLADPKERAEHVMLVDLARNDIGRVAKPGTVETPMLHAGVSEEYPLERILVRQTHARHERRVEVHVLLAVHLHHPDLVGNEKLSFLRPAVVSLGEFDLLFAERFAVGGLGVAALFEAV